MPALEHISRNAYIIIPWVILLLPLAGFTVLALFGEAIARDKEENGAAVLACATVLGSFALSVWVVLGLLKLPAGESGLHVAQPYLGFEWIAAGGLLVPFSLLLDHLSAVMILTVTGIGSLIHIYSFGYMAHDEERVRYFSYLNLFTFFMLLLVLGGNLPLMFVGWEGVGLCSYLLIGFWFKKKSASDAGMKAFIVNRIGDVGLILGMIVAFHAWGTLDLFELAEHASNLPREGLGELGVITVVGLLLFLGAAGKSAQIPLHVWLPDAMEGPTPVSALIHAATMVTAGVYMVARLAPLYSRSATAMTAVAVIGAATALMAATVALVQTDIKQRARLLDGQPARLHVPGLRRGRLRRWRLPPLHPRVLQGAAVPRLGIGDPCPGRRAGHAEDGRPAQPDPRDVLDVRHRHGWPSPDRALPGGLLQQGRDPGRDPGRGPARPLRPRPLHRAAHGVLHVAAALHDLLRPLQGRRGDRASHPRVALEHARAVGGPGRRLLRGGPGPRASLRGAPVLRLAEPAELGDMPIGCPIVASSRRPLGIVGGAYFYLVFTDMPAAHRRLVRGPSIGCSRPNTASTTLYYAFVSAAGRTAAEGALEAASTWA